MCPSSKPRFRTAKRGDNWLLCWLFLAVIPITASFANFRSVSTAWKAESREKLAVIGTEIFSLFHAASVRGSAATIEQRSFMELNIAQFLLSPSYRSWSAAR